MTNIRRFQSCNICRFEQSFAFRPLTSAFVAAWQRVITLNPSYSRRYIIQLLWEYKNENYKRMCRHKKNYTIYYYNIAQSLTCSVAPSSTRFSAMCLPIAISGALSSLALCWGNGMCPSTSESKCDMWTDASPNVRGMFLFICIHQGQTSIE